MDIATEGIYLLTYKKKKGGENAVQAVLAQLGQRRRRCKARYLGTHEAAQDPSTKHLPTDSLLLTLPRVLFSVLHGLELVLQGPPLAE
jgi:hypothetical protein